jgi:hypothetical protein
LTNLEKVIFLNNYNKKINFSHFNNSVLWSPKSPYFTLMDFFLSGYLKNLVYPSCSLPDLHNKIGQNIQNILPETLENFKKRLGPKTSALCYK